MTINPNLISTLGVIISSLIASGVAIAVATLKSRWDRDALQRQLSVEVDAKNKEFDRVLIDRKIDIAYKYAELKQKDQKMADSFLREISKETAIGFLFQENGEAKYKIWIRNEANLLIGRNVSCDVVIEEQTVSREHCVVHTAGGVAYVIPLAPTNPVILNGERIFQKSRLEGGSHLRIGLAEFIYFRF